jgi:hypothetical protein
MTFTATKRLYLSQIVFYLTGSSGETSSSSASSSFEFDFEFNGDFLNLLSYPEQFLVLQ